MSRAVDAPPQRKERQLPSLEEEYALLCVDEGVDTGMHVILSSEFAMPAMSPSDSATRDLGGAAAKISADIAAEAPACAICLSDLAQYGCTALSCGHCFHARCIEPWIARSRPPTCPECRTPIDAQERGGASCARSDAPFANLEQLIRLPEGSTLASAPLQSMAPAARAYVSRPPASTRAFLAGQAFERTLDPSVEHHLIDDDVGIDDLERDNVSDADLAAFGLSWSDARRLGLRRAHFARGWLRLDRVHNTFDGVTWDDLARDLELTLGDVLASEAEKSSATSPAPNSRGAPAPAPAPAPALGPLPARVLGKLGLTVQKMRECGLTRERFIAASFTMQEWIGDLKLRRADLTSLRLRAEDFRTLCKRRGWSALVLEFDLGYTPREIVNMGIPLEAGGLDHVVLKV